MALEPRAPLFGTHLRPLFAEGLAQRFADRRTVQSLPFGAPDGGTTDLFFLLCSQDEQIHLHVLARLCTMCQRTRMIPALREAAEAAALYAILVQAEEEIIRQL